MERIAHGLLADLEAAEWQTDAVERVIEDNAAYLPEDARRDELRSLLVFACTEIIPRLARTEREIDQILRALEGRFIEAGPSGSPMRGLVNVLPTGRNFYSVDPKSLPSRLAWETGQLLADSLVARYKEEHGEYPKSVGLSVWGTSAMRTSGSRAVQAATKAASY